MLEDKLSRRKFTSIAFGSLIFYILIARNKTKKYPRSSDPKIYARATGFETLIGWLFLKDPKRLGIIFEYLEIKTQ